MASPGGTPDSEVFRAYLALVAGVLVLAGAGLAVWRVVRQRPIGHAGAAYRGWLIMAPLVLLCVFLGRVATVALLTGVALQGFRELARASDLARAPGLSAVVSAGILAGGVASLLPDAAGGHPGGPGLFLTLPVYVVPVVLLVPIVGNRAAGQLRLTSLAVLAFMLLGFLFGHLALLAGSRAGLGPLLFLLVATELSDVAAYTAGRLFGRHALRDRISPAKTREGFAGGLLAALCLPWGLRFSLPGLDTPHLLLVGLIIGVGGPLGDLSVSLIKRELGVKDLGTLIPGHGGILDRIDSLIVTAPLFYHLLPAAGL